MSAIAHLNRLRKINTGTYKLTDVEERYHGRPIDYGYSFYQFAQFFLLGTKHQPRNFKQVYQRIRTLMKNGYSVEIVANQYLLDVYEVHLWANPTSYYNLGRLDPTFVLSILDNYRTYCKTGLTTTANGRHKFEFPKVKPSAAVNDARYLQSAMKLALKHGFELHLNHGTISNRDGMPIGKFNRGDTGRLAIAIHELVEAGNY